MSVSLVMIVRDEEHCITRALTSIFPFVNEIIIVDTGSVDKTVEIARSFGATVYDYVWDNNFSNARNFGIEKAINPFVFIMDADEYLSAGGEYLRDELDKEITANTVIVKRLIAFGDEKIVTAQYKQCRLFSNEVRYEGSVLEQPVLENMTCAESPIVIEQVDFEATSANRCERNIEIALKTLAAQESMSQSEKIMAHFFLAKEYFALNDWENSYSHFENALSINSDIIFSPDSRIANEFVTKYLHCVSIIKSFSKMQSFFKQYTQRFIFVPGYFHSMALVLMAWTIEEPNETAVLLPATKIALSQVLEICQQAIEKHIFIEGILPQDYIEIAKGQQLLIQEAMKLSQH